MILKPCVFLESGVHLASGAEWEPSGAEWEPSGAATKRYIVCLYAIPTQYFSPGMYAFSDR